jgi:hypothetical protein
MSRDVMMPASPPLIQAPALSITTKSHHNPLTYLKNCVHTFSLCVADRTQPVSSYRTRQKTWHVGNDEAKGATTRASQQAPEAIIGSAIRLRHALLAQHLLEDITELRILSLLLCGACLLLLLLRSRLLGKEVPCPVVGRLRTGAGAGVVGIVSLGKGVSGGRGGAFKELALAVVFPAPRGVGEGVVGVIHELELAGARGPLRGVGWDAVRVGLEGGPFVGISDLLGICRLLNLKDGVYGVCQQLGCSC